MQKTDLLFQSIKSITVPELKEKLLENPVLSDVRVPAEYRSGHIKGAKNVPLQSINRYDGDKERTVYVIYQSGMRSKQAAKELKESGYDVMSVCGGMNQWSDQTMGGK